MLSFPLAARLVNSFVLAGLVLFFFLGPAVLVVRDLCDPAIRSGTIPQRAWELHRSLSPKIAKWANVRTDSMRATQLSTSDVAGTEWPLFGSVFYLWATESLQDAWLENPALSAQAPSVYARPTLDALARLVTDPNQASWVQKYWGKEYLHKEDVFYRMLVISGLTSYTRLTGDSRYLPMLRNQVETLSGVLDASPHGLLNDYPGQCYPADVLAAIASIHRADRVLGSDHSAFIQRAFRAFDGTHSENDHGLIPFMADPGTGKMEQVARGCGNSFISLAAPELWPEQARHWYDLYSQQYWQEVWTGVGFREFSRETIGPDWWSEVDAGPVIKGFGISACAFGVGAARVNGHMEQAYPLTAEMYSASWPLPGGMLFIPRLLSNALDAPYVGEIGVIYNLTRRPAPGIAVKAGGRIPGFTWIILSIQVFLGNGALAGDNPWRGKNFES